MADGEPLFEAAGLAIAVAPGGPEVLAVRDVSFCIEAGELVALVGESGSGKSLTALAMIGLLPPEARRVRGSLRLAGVGLERNSEPEWRRLRGREIGFCFQEPRAALNPVLSIGSQLIEARKEGGACDRRDARARALALLERVGMPDADQRFAAFPHQLSGGQRQRAMLAIALASGPRLLIADEPTSALDGILENEILELIDRLRSELGLGVLWITHDLGAVRRFADRVLVMHAGEIVEQAPAGDLFASPLHPYSRGLLRSLPPSRRGPGRAKLPTLPGQPPSLRDRPVGCAFHPRCDVRESRCSVEEPPWRRVSPERGGLCWRIEGGGAGLG